MKVMKKNTVTPPSNAPMERKIKAYAAQSRALLLSQLKNPQNLLPLGAAFFAGAQIADAQFVYSGIQNIGCALGVNTNRCYANINGAGGNDLEIHRNHAFGNQFIQVDEVPGGGFEITGFHARVVGIYVYPYANGAGVTIGAGGPWGFQTGQANSLSEINNAYPNDAWTPLPNGTTRYLGIRGTVGGQTKYGWVQLTKNSFGNHTIVDWAYNNTTGASILTGQSMPVELMSFDYRLDANDLKLTWQTVSETENAGFEVERSEDGQTYKVIGWVDGHGTTLEPQSYGYNDKSLVEGKLYYYRLRQVDHNGTFEYSTVLTVKVGTKGTVAGEFFPNPATGSQSVSLEFTTKTGGNWDAILFDATGKEVRRKAMQVAEGKHNLSFELNGLETGIYFMKLDNGFEKLYRKLSIQ